MSDENQTEVSDTAPNGPAQPTEPRPDMSPEELEAAQAANEAEGLGQAAREGSNDA